MSTVIPMKNPTTQNHTRLPRKEPRAPRPWLTPTTTPTATISPRPRATQPITWAAVPLFPTIQQTTLLHLALPRPSLTHTALCHQEGRDPINTHLGHVGLKTM
jgi:hypothetical protein